MFHAAISQLTTSRWELPEEIARLAHHGFDCLSLWRAKLSDCDHATAASLLSRAGMRVSSLQWAGGFTGGDGRTFAESLDDAAEAIDTAAFLGAPVLVVHSGCRAGHTRAHARRLLLHALATLAPLADAAGVTLAVKPLHAAAAAGCSFLDQLPETLALVEEFSDPAVRLALDLWHFGDAPELPGLLPRLAAATAVVQVADRTGPPTVEMERLPVGQGTLPLESLSLALMDHGYSGDFEFDPVGAAVASLGYDQVLAATRRVTDAWAHAVTERLLWNRAAAAVWQTAGNRSAAAGIDPGLPGWSPMRGTVQLRSAGSRRSQASSQTVSRGCN
ncbi:MAG: sugar phosphate isomerase/epimerase family protein [Planctomycetia bacterium]